MAKFKCPRFAVLVCGLQSLSRVVISGGQPSPAISEHLAKTHDARLADAWPGRRGAIINTLNHVSPFQRLTRPSASSRSPFHHHGTLIYPRYPRLCTYLGPSCSCTHIATLLARHEILHARSPLVPGFTILAALHRGPAIGASGRLRFDRRRNGRTTGPQGGRVQQEKRRSGNTARAAGGVKDGSRTTRPRLPEARERGTVQSTSLEHASPVPQGHTPAPRLADKSITPPSLPALPSGPSPGDHLHPLPPSTPSTPSTPARRAETHPASLAAFGTRGLTVSIPFQRLGGIAHLYLPSHRPPSIEGQPSPRESPNSLLENENNRSWPGKARPVNPHPAQTETAADALLAQPHTGAFLYSNTYNHHQALISRLVDYYIAATPTSSPILILILAISPPPPISTSSRLLSDPGAGPSHVLLSWFRSTLPSTPSKRNTQARPLLLNAEQTNCQNAIALSLCVPTKNTRELHRLLSTRQEVCTRPLW
ncbi:uncharacterized protein K444DRAFT_630778 [Hyaloscypha bicolor E]|uniref:C2H2-type domain-containing protein n=1 Tax=Hyaloscypha bicolor E TaxID=1095630 RepID=A0A2J6T817_9HELO|nr:uncharacterized protein K444DRAFT_630778 [Hyaloscypha bicolor E]PMD59156.1 hypothetical protein K444DRAFT_630778 [Hyaloscypha bicolor E]